MPDTTTAPIPLHGDRDDDAGPPWITVSLHPPTPNCLWAGFIDDAGAIEARKVDFMALQEIDDDDEPDTRIVGIVMDWTGIPIVCALDAGNGFAAFAADDLEAERRARAVLQKIRESAQAQP